MVLCSSLSVSLPKLINTDDAELKQRRTLTSWRTILTLRHWSTRQRKNTFCTKSWLRKERVWVPTSLPPMLENFKQKNATTVNCCTCLDTFWTYVEKIYDGEEQEPCLMVESWDFPCLWLLNAYYKHVNLTNDLIRKPNSNWPLSNCQKLQCCITEIKKRIWQRVKMGSEKNRWLWIVALHSDVEVSLPFPSACCCHSYFLVL